MGKSEKAKKTNRRMPFYKEIIDANIAKSTTRSKVRNPQQKHEETIIDKKLTQKILTEAQKQLEDIEEEVGLGSLCDDLQTSHLYAGLPDENNACEESHEKENFQQENFVDETEFNTMLEDLDKKTALVDALREKITEKRTEIHTLFSDRGSLREENTYVLSTFKTVGRVLSMYRSGKIPKPFKILPKFANWEELLYLTEPENWSSAAMREATIIFSSNLKEEMVQRFYNFILLPRIRDEIAQCKKLNLHMYEAVKKALFKPKAFFRGIILPLCESGTCTKQEARILSGILLKTSTPYLHPSIALWLISRLKYSDANCMFIRALLEKKYTLPSEVIDRVVDYFLKFAKEDKLQPLIWHLCLLTFVEIYKNTLSQDQHQELLNLLKNQHHHKVSVEIRKELLSANCQSKETSVNQ